MEEKLRSILDNYEERIIRYEKEIEDLTSKKKFCQDHKFDEEVRIIRVRLDALEMKIFNWRNMHTEIKELLAAWGSH